MGSADVHNGGCGNTLSGHGPAASVLYCSWHGDKNMKETAKALMVTHPHRFMAAASGASAAHGCQQC
eukprot:354507-Chlamydomonas_euryale.AAC.6